MQVVPSNQQSSWSCVGGSMESLPPEDDPFFSCADGKLAGISKYDKMDIFETMKQLEDLCAGNEKLKKRKSALMTAAFNSNLADAVDVFFKNCVTTRCSLLDTIRQLECVIAGNYIYDEDIREPMILNERIELEAECEIVTCSLEVMEETVTLLPSTPKVMNMGGVIFRAGGLDLYHKPARRVQISDSGNKKWIDLGERGEMKEGRFFGGLVGANGWLYAIGGRNEIGELFSAEVFIPELGEWHEIAPMNGHAIPFGGAAHANGTIYVIGGSDSTKAEKYDIESNQWTQLPVLKVSREGFGCAVLDNLLYSIGGAGTSCERYSPETNTWENIASMSQKRMYMGVCVLNEFLYAVGGYDKISLTSVERYDSKTDKWTSVAELNTPRYNCSVVVMNGLLYAIGGTNGKGSLKSVEVYSADSDTWMFATDLNEATFGDSAAWVDCSLDIVLTNIKKKEESDYNWMNRLVRDGDFEETFVEDESSSNSDLDESETELQTLTNDHESEDFRDPSRIQSLFVAESSCRRKRRDEFCLSRTI